MVTPPLRVLLTLLCLAAPALGADDGARVRLLLELPDSRRGALVAVTGDALVVAGGRSEAGVVTPSIFVMPGDSERWTPAGSLPLPLTDGVAVSTPAGMITVGGWDGQRAVASVLALRWNRVESRIELSELPDLPQPRRHAAAAAIGSTIYVAGGIGPDGPASDFWGLDLNNSAAGWRSLPAWEGPPRSNARLVAQSDGNQTSLFLIGGWTSDAQGASDGSALSDVHRYTPPGPGVRGGWTRIEDLPSPVGLAPAIASGQSHILIFADRSTVERHSAELLLYHTITRTCVVVDELNFSTADAAAVRWRGQATIVGAADPTGAVQTLAVSIPGPKPKFGPLDYIVLISYLLIITGVGLWFTRSEKTTGQFFLAGKRIPWWAAALSLMATQVSSIGFMAIPAKTFATDWSYFAGIFTWFIAVPIVTRIFIPFFRRLDVTSAYEYLEVRFNVVVRQFAAITFCLMQIGRSAVVLYLPALALAAVTGLDLFVCIVVMGVLATAYTVAGGMAAVIWTDVIQAGVLLGGALLCVVVVVFSLDGGGGEFVRVAMSDSKFDMIHLRWDFASTALWVLIVGNTFSRLAIFTSDQAVVQRYLTTRDVKQAQRALWGDVAVSIPWALIVFLLGTALYVHYKTDPTALNPAVDVDGIVPFFIAQELPTGISGLIIAAVFAAAMSSLDSSIHSVATVAVTDFYKRFVPESSDHRRLVLARGVTLAMGVFATGMAIVLAITDIRSIWDFYIGLLGLFVGVIAGFFFLGIFTTRAGGVGAVLGGVVGGIAVYLVQSRTSVSVFLFPAVGLLVTFAAGYLFSLLSPRGADPAALTIYSPPEATDGV